MKKLMIIMVLIIPMMLSAQGMMGHGKKEVGDRGMMGFQKLELTDAQKEQLHKMQIDFKKQQIKLYADLKLANIDLQEMISNDVTGKKLDTAIDNVATLKMQLFKTRTNHRVEMRKILTDEQKAELKKLRRGRMHQRFDRKKECGGDCGENKEKPGFGQGHPRFRDGK